MFFLEPYKGATENYILEVVESTSDLVFQVFAYLIDPDNYPYIYDDEAPFPDLKNTTLKVIDNIKKMGLDADNFDHFTKIEEKIKMFEEESRFRKSFVKLETVYKQLLG